MQWLRAELCYAIRGIRKNPGFTAIMVLTLALGIGSNAAVFSIADAVVLQPLPGKDPRQLVRLYSTQEKGGAESDALSYPQFKEYRDNLRSFSSMAAYRTVALEVAVEGEAAQRIPGAVAGGSFFDATGISPVYGRLFSESDDGPRGSNPVAVLSERFWRRTFDGRPDVVGSLIQINGFRYTVIGIAPRSLEELERAPQVWVPMSMAAEAEPIMANQIDRLANGFFKVVARLNPGTSIQRAQLDLDVVGQRLGAGQTVYLWEQMETERVQSSKISPPAGLQVEVHDWTRPWVAVAAAKKNFSPEEGRLSWLLLGVAALVLLIATIDVAGLWLARAEAEESESAIRAALGASRWALFRLCLIQGLVVSFLGGVAGLFLASWTGNLLFATAPDGLAVPVGVASPVLSHRAGVFVAAASFLACVLFTLLPQLRHRSRDISERLKKQSPASTGHAGSRTQSVLVIAQIVASVVLLVGAGLLIQTMQNIARIDLGFETEHVLSATLDLSRHGYIKT
jgi:putative ABC transport system permease protein